MIQTAESMLVGVELVDVPYVTEVRRISSTTFMCASVVRSVSAVACTPSTAA
jgi:hypothetical protein